MAEGMLEESATGNGPVGKEVSSAAAGGTTSLLHDASGCGTRPGHAPYEATCSFLFLCLFLNPNLYSAARTNLKRQRRSRKVRNVSRHVW